jgi:HlyD family secretion protein
VAPGTAVITVADTSRVWLRGFVDETDLGKIHLGQDVEVSTDSFPGKIYRGTLAFIASEAEFTPKTVQTNKERVKLVFRVKIDLENEHGELKPGMPADAVLATGA